ncbi:hypothetical protein Ae201684P_017904 [Aphanomyces euteiches]|uniref:Uncharacterized protein n=1 Tax=Aphanomyces euteiches TaxID=100861 RepID=A0A6G0XMN8_9STRA|nr:hypothetical protein Ae201684_003242 [Aphanomyces euteiches]KAH9098693.1 hypothetical protein Ae201684P_017904 [Aphanomyces euteiches]
MGKKTTKKESAATPAQTNEQGRLPTMLRVILVCACSIMGERAWQNREVVTQHLYNDNQTPAQQTLISIFAYFALMGAIFLGGVVLSKFTTFAARFL